MENGYTKAHRTYELTVIAIAVGLAGLFFVRALQAPWGALTTTQLTMTVVGAFPLGVLAADLTSGLIHWAFDTFGDENTPVLGGLAIRTFREHHRLPKKMLEHDFVETNGHNIGLTIPVWIGGVLCASGDANHLMWAPFFVSWAFAVGITSQIHKWSHMDVAPRPIQWLQNARLILHPTDHNYHHIAPYTSHYCIATGWGNIFWWHREPAIRKAADLLREAEAAGE